MPDRHSVAAVRRRLRTPVPWRFRVARWYAQIVNFSIVGAVAYGLVSAGLTRSAGNVWAALGLSVLGAAVLLRVSLAFGPVFVGADRMFWVLSAPVSRAEFLRPRVFGLLGLGAGVGALWPAVVFGLVGAVASPVVAMGSGAAAGVAVVALALVVQRLRHGWRRAGLAAGAALAGVVRVSVSWFDLALLGAILAERRARALGRVRSAELRGSRLVVLVWTDVLRLRRTPYALIVWAALLPVPALVAVCADAVPAVHLLAAFLATDRLAAGLRFVCRSPAMRRALGLSDRYLRAAHLVFPAAGAAIWCAITTAFTPHVSVLNGLISAVGAVAVVYRIATRPPVDYGAAIVDFGLFGPTPLGLIVQLSRGPALLAALAFVQLAV
ncbi:DUF6297 family protein [Lentzea sp. NPDC051838]|uniref:DUF6297 family protein n=1 Tax=Lentzea sp. NPDC051838 TaxID=3154849 RepID=UPI00342614C3